MTDKHTPGRKFSVVNTNAPWLNHSFMVRGVCELDVLNPCWDDRADDVPGKHWSGLGNACPSCTRAAIAKAEGR